MSDSAGQEMYQWASDLFPLCRSLTGPGVRDTLRYLQHLMPAMKICETPSGSQAFDWTVPDEWTVSAAYIEDESGNHIIDFCNHNLHLVGYSIPIDAWMGLTELQAHLHSLPEQPDAIPYVTSYYRRDWGFCLSHHQRLQLADTRYHVVIKSTLAPGVMNYGELLIPGETSQEILLSTYICHPSMANNELSGPVVTCALAQWISRLEKRRYSYRILFIPETIGAIMYLSQHAEMMKQRTIAGFVVTCIGDDRCYSWLPSKYGDTLADRASLYVLENDIGDFRRYSFLDRGSDERQYNAAGIDLPVCSVMRSKYGEYPEYHTSLDDLSLISPEGLLGGYNVLRKILQLIEINKTYLNKICCEPQLGKRGLYPQLSIKNNKEYDQARVLLDFLAYADGRNDLLEIAKIIHADVFYLHQLAQKLMQQDIIETIDEVDATDEATI